MALRARKLKNRDHFLTPTSPQNGVEHVCFMHLALLGGFYGDFEIWFFLRAVSHLKMTKSTLVQKKVPTWEGKVLERKQKQF